MNTLIKTFQKALLFPLLLALLLLCEADALGQKRVEEYLATLKATGTEPLRFVNHVLDKYDLIVFDDAIHSAYEPFVFYSDILEVPHISEKIDFVFIEVFSIGSQPLIDKYFTDTIKKRATLQKVFQDDFSGFGWRYETYINLLESIWDINHSKEMGKK